MKVAVTGASGLVGRSLSEALVSRGDNLITMVRDGAVSPERIPWSATGELWNPAPLEGIDSVVHLAGENIASGRWNSGLKERIWKSRVEGTRSLARALASLDAPPRVLVCASATGYYGNRGAEPLSEVSAVGEGFLAELCEAWEGAAEPARAADIRVVHLRIGVVLSTEGGALAQMLLPFKLGVGGAIGRGDQFWSWITLDDLVAAILHALDKPDLSGVVNAVSPSPVTCREFARSLGRVLRRPSIVPLPAPAARLMLGEMADELLLASTRVYPVCLQQSGFEFLHADLEEALASCVG